MCLLYNEKYQFKLKTNLKVFYMHIVFWAFLVQLLFSLILYKTALLFSYLNPGSASAHLTSPAYFWNRHINAGTQLAQS